VEDDAQTKFYKARMRRSETPHMSGRTPIYDFDEWSRLHYGENFDRTRAAQQRFNRKSEQKVAADLSIKNEKIIILTFMVFALFLANFYSETKNDTVKVVETSENNNKPKDRT
jgi:DnaJ homolog subfamily C member 30